MGNDPITDLSQPVSSLVASVKYEDLSFEGTSPPILRSLDAFVDHGTSELPGKPQLLQFLQQFHLVKPLFSGNHPKNQQPYSTAAQYQESVLDEMKPNDIEFCHVLIAVALHLLIVTDELDELTHCEQPPLGWWSEPPGRHLSLKSRVTDRKGGPCPSIELHRTYNVSVLPEHNPSIFPLPRTLEQLFQATLALLLKNRPEDWLFYFNIELILGRICTNLDISDWTTALDEPFTIARIAYVELKLFAKNHVMKGITPFNRNIDVEEYKAKVPNNPASVDEFRTMKETYITHLDEAYENGDLPRGYEEERDWMTH